MRNLETEPRKKCICASTIIIDEGKVLLLWHRKLGVWLYPGGHVDPGEVPPEAAVREAREETGLDVRIVGQNPSALIRTGDAYEMPSPFMVMYEHVPYRTGVHEHFDMVYLAERKNGETHGQETETRWFSEPEIDGLETYENVKLVLHKAFKSHA